MTFVYSDHYCIVDRHGYYHTSYATPVLVDWKFEAVLVHDHIGKVTLSFVPRSIGVMYVVPYWEVHIRQYQSLPRELYKNYHRTMRSTDYFLEL